MPYQLHWAPVATDEELAEDVDLLEELELTTLLELDLTLLELDLTLLALDLDELLLVLPKLVANFDVALMPLALLMRKLPQVLRLAGSQLMAISNAVQQPPLPLQLQPM